jgi:hypothetical protein
MCGHRAFVCPALLSAAVPPYVAVSTLPLVPQDNKAKEAARLKALAKAEAAAAGGPLGGTGGPAGGAGGAGAGAPGGPGRGSRRTGKDSGSMG